MIFKNFTHHEAFEYFELKNYPDTRGKVPGVYCIAGIYVGATNHMRKRFITHFYSLKRGWHTCKPLQEKFDQAVENDEMIEVEALDFDPNKERFYHEKMDSQSKDIFFYDEMGYRP